MTANDLAAEVKQGLHMRADYLLKQPIDPAEPSYRYFLENPSSTPPPPEVPPKKGQPVEVPQIQPKAGTDVTEVLVGLWQEVEFITLAEPLSELDQNSVKALHKVHATGGKSCRDCWWCACLIFLRVLLFLSFCSVCKRPHMT